MGSIEQSLRDMAEVLNGLREEVRELRAEVRVKSDATARWTVEDLMRYAHKKRTWATEQLTAGRVPKAVKVGNRWLLDPEATKRWLGKI